MKKALPTCTVLLLVILMVQLVPAASQLSLSGYLTCSKCGAKGATESHRDCMEQCLAKGSNVLLYTDDDHHLIRIENPDAVKGHHAHRVILDGYMNGDAFHVISLRIL
jgi:hypothetical protein